MAVTGTLFSQAYQTDGVSTVFAYPDYLFQFSDLTVQYIDSSNATHNLVRAVDYNLTGTPDSFGAYPSGVNVTTINTGTFGSPLPAGGQISMSRFTARTQNIIYVNGDAFPANRTEHALDKLTLMIQEMAPGFRGAYYGIPTGAANTNDWILMLPFVAGGQMFWVCTKGDPANPIWNPAAMIGL